MGLLHHHHLRLLVKALALVLALMELALVMNYHRPRHMPLMMRVIYRN